MGTYGDITAAAWFDSLYMLLGAGFVMSMNGNWPRRTCFHYILWFVSYGVPPSMSYHPHFRFDLLQYFGFDNIFMGGILVLIVGLFLRSS